MKFNKFFMKQREYLPFWISLAFIIIISAFAYHYDFYWLTKFAERTASGDLNLYQTLTIAGHDSGKFIMPPLIALVDAFLYFILKEIRVINPSFDWISGGQIPSLQLLLYKSRYILIFILSYPLAYNAAFLFTKQNKELARRIANLWIASPLLIYLPFAQGNNDIYPAVFTLVFLLFAFRKNYIMAMIFLGLTAALKNYALFLILPVALILSDKDLKKTILYCLTSSLVYFLPALVFFKGLTSFAWGNTENLSMLKTVIPSYNFNYSIFTIGYFLILIFLYFSDNMNKLIEEKDETLVTYCFLVLSLFFVTFFFPQWFLWILPFFVFLIYKNTRLYWLYLMISFVYLLSLITNWPNNLDLNLWQNILPTLTPGMKYFPGVYNSTMMSLVPSLFVALFIGFVYFLLSDRGNKIKEELKHNSVFLSYMPTISNILLLIFFLLISIHLSNSKDYENKLVLKAISDQNQKSTLLMSDSIFNQDFTVKNVKKEVDGEFIPTNQDSQFFFNNLAVAPTNNDYVVVRFKDKKSYNPQFFGMRATKQKTSRRIGLFG